MFPNRNRPAAHQHRAQDPEDEYDQQRQIHRMPELALPDAPGPGWHEETFIEANEVSSLPHRLFPPALTLPHLLRPAPLGALLPI
jgi:hypothetical protein